MLGKMAGAHRMETVESAQKERTVGDVLGEIRKVRRWLGPNNASGRMLRECDLVIRELADKLGEARRRIAELENARNCQ